MGMYLNPNNKRFTKSRKNPLYVDKSLLIQKLNAIIDMDECQVCVSRPRRFGKSTDAKMLSAYYSKGCDSSVLFDDLKISQTKDYYEHLNKHNVILIDMQAFYDKDTDVKKMIQFLSTSVLREIFKIYKDIEYRDNTDLPNCLDDIYAELDEDFIFIIDEWDCVLRNRESTSDDKKYFLTFMSRLLKEKDYVSLTYMTGILPIKKYGNESALNMFKEITMISPTPLEHFMGFTEDEVKELCTQHHMDFEQMKSWYDGYHIDNNVSLYNPRSIVFCISDRKYANYWTDTGTFEVLKDYIVMDQDGLKEDILKILTGEEVEINASKFKNDMSSFKTKDDVLTLLVHLGYLGYHTDTKTVYIPNKEVEDSFINAIEDSSWDEINKAIKDSKKLLDATLAMDEETVSYMIEESHDKEIDLYNYNDENSMACLLKLCYWQSRSMYEISREDKSGKGRCDMLFIPKKANIPAFVIELKVNDTPKNAISQIIKKNYIQKIENFKEILLVGISYNTNSKDDTYKKHQVKIVKYKG
ncbi:MAG: ATP-binding protein [Erysipelotrichaceae bacterium]|nr:ATP-binding protein [Erysipelotrichaceae bacterium]